jgi:succinyl-CoA synthetase alpha subunit
VSILLNTRTRVIVQGATGWQAARHIPLMRDYGTRVVAGVSPGRSGEPGHAVPIFDSVAEALHACGDADFSVLFVPGRRVLDAGIEAIDAGVPNVLVLAEGVPFRDSIELLGAAADAGVRIVGPNSQGIITPGEAKMGGCGGDNPARLFLPGRVGVVSRSGGMGAETCWALTRRNIGQSTYVAVGGELINGSSLTDIALLFDQDADTRAIVVFGEPGTDQEEALAEAVAAGRIGKPVIAYIPGHFVESLPQGMSFGHAGAIISGSRGVPSVKRRLLREAGVAVADRWSDIPDLVRERGGDAPPVRDTVSVLVDSRDGT